MDVSRLRQGEKIAGASGIALLLIMFIFDWFGLKAGGAEISGNAWDTLDLIRFILLLAGIAAIALAYTSASGTSVSLPVALSAIVAGLGILSVVLVLFRIISPPDLGGLGDFGGVDKTRKFGAFLGLIAAAGVAYGGYSAMQEEGTSFEAQADRLRDRDAGPGPGPGAGPGTGGPGAPPPSA
jgi:hypothetical protein